MAKPKVTRRSQAVQYKKCTAIWFFSSGQVGPQSCEVHFAGKEIVVAFAQSKDFDHTIWRGKEQGSGHYILRADVGYGEAALHRFEGGGFLDGYWEEDDGEGSRDSGMVRIRLEDVHKPV